MVVFLKDDISYENMHQLGEWRDLNYLARLASSDQGFVYGINSIDVTFSQRSRMLTHQSQKLFSLTPPQNNQSAAFPPAAQTNNQNTCAVMNDHVQSTDS
jgi:hypothetical protein